MNTGRWADADGSMGLWKEGEWILKRAWDREYAK